MKRFFLHLVCILAIFSCKKEDVSVPFSPAPCFKDDGKPHALPISEFGNEHMSYDVFRNGNVLVKLRDSIFIYDPTFDLISKFWISSKGLVKALSDDNFLIISSEKTPVSNRILDTNWFGAFDIGRNEDCSSNYQYGRSWIGSHKANYTTRIKKISQTGEVLFDRTIQGYSHRDNQYHVFLEDNKFYIALSEIDSIASNLEFYDEGITPKDTIRRNYDDGRVLFYCMNLQGDIIWQQKMENVLIYNMEQQVFLSKSRTDFWIATEYEIFSLDLGGKLKNRFEYPIKGCKERFRSMAGYDDQLFAYSTANEQDTLGTIYYRYMIDAAKNITDLSNTPNLSMYPNIIAAEDKLYYKWAKNIYSYNGNVSTVYDGEANGIELRSALRRDCNGNFYCIAIYNFDYYLIKITADGRDPF